MISKIIDKILSEIDKLLNRSIDFIYTIIFIDGIVFKVKEENEFIKKLVYLKFRLNLESKIFLTFSISESESSKQWLTLFNELKEKCLKDILIFCWNDLNGISDAIKSSFPNALIQKCIIHQIRNSNKFVRYDDLK